MQREKWSIRKKRDYANEVVDTMEQKGEIRALYRDFKHNLEAAREVKVSPKINAPLDSLADDASFSHRDTMRDKQILPRSKLPVLEVLGLDNKSLVSES